MNRPPLSIALPPIADPDARVLLLGSMPGLASLAAQQYYAHPRNTFWPLLGALLGFNANAPYAERVTALLAARIAVWDVLAACRRHGSLDSAILPASEQANDFGVFLRAHPGIRLVAFNGGAAYALFRRHALPQLGSAAANLTLRQLPSTSPAHAARTFEDKLVLWRAVMAPP